jgi:predicted nucleic acid binding AN1-type Zn finger protein
MAELPEVGQHCSYKGLGESQACGYLDFLPFKCENCGGIYCEDHRFPDKHSCKVTYEKVIPTCPICSQIIYIKAGGDVNAEVNRHINMGCPVVQKPEIRSFACTFNNCKVKELQRIRCPHCNKDFCSLHKYPTSHTCTKPAPKQPIKQPAQDGPSFWDVVTDRLTDMMRGFQESDNPKARQAALMNMKNKAIGQKNIPTERRFYLEVLFPMESKVQPKMMYFDSNSVFGLILDQIAETGRIKNQNNIADAKKLQLISIKTGKPFALNEKPKDSTAIASGDSILLEYVNMQS